MSNPLAPPIYSPLSPEVRLSVFSRCIAMVIALGALAPLVMAAFLTPSPTGIGTHTALGLQPCMWEQTMGFPCPTCGMTTSWSYFARGNIAASLYIQPMGALLAFLDAILFWSGLYIAGSGRAAHYLLLRLPTGYIGWNLLGLWLLAWGWKIFIHLHHLDGWR